MTKLKIFLLTLFLLSLCGCSFYNNQVSDVTFLSPPEEDDTVSGIWSVKDDDLLATELYIYGNGNYVALFQDPEEETWVCDGHWKEDNGYSFEPVDRYAFDQESGKWIESIDNFGSGMGNLNSNRLDLKLTLPNQQMKEVSLTKESLSIDIPEVEEITVLVNNFLEL